MIPIPVLANNGMSPNDRITDTPSRTAGGIIECAYSRGGNQGGREEDNSQKVTHPLQSRYPV